MKHLALFLVFTFASFAFAENLSIVTYNVENLFDTEHDDEKSDWEYTPLGTEGKEENCQLVSERYRQKCLDNDWTLAKMMIKINKIKQALNLNLSKMPDVLALQEVENEIVVGELAKALGYTHFVMTDSPDHRGIDVACLYNERAGFVFEKFDTYRMSGLPQFEKKPTRDVLRADFKYEGRPLSIFVNHWPSQGAASPKPWETDKVNLRTFVAKKIKAATDEMLKLDPSRSIVLTGDFNTIKTDYPHPFYTVLFQGENRFVDIHTTYLTDEIAGRKIIAKYPRGTYFFVPQMTWNLFDRFFVSLNMMQENAGIKAKLDSYRVLSAGITKNFGYNRTGEYQAGSVITGVPQKWNSNAGSLEKMGYSDHLPVYFELEAKSVVTDTDSKTKE